MLMTPWLFCFFDVIVIFTTCATLKFWLLNFHLIKLKFDLEVDFRGPDYKFQLKKWIKGHVLTKKGHSFDFG